MSKSLLIVGTNTDVGKTYVTTALATYYQRYHSTSELGILKLMQTGIGDRELYQELFAADAQIEVVTPLHFTAPLAPPVAAALEDKIIDLKIVWQELTRLQQSKECVLVEALGGLGSPVTSELTVADIAAQWRLPTLLVVPIALGAIAQAVANVALARSLNINLQGIVLSCTEATDLTQQNQLAPQDLIESLTQTRILGTMPYVENLSDRDKLASIVSDWHLEYLGALF